MQFLDITCIALAAALAASGTARAQTPISISAPTSATATLSVAFTDIEAKQGSIMLALYDEAGWNGGKPVRAEMVDASTGQADVSISDLPAGRYGVKAFHDVNSNGQMDTNPFGMPTEPFAFSNNAHGQAGPAAWGDAAFTVAPGSNTQSIVIR